MQTWDDARWSGFSASIVSRIDIPVGNGLNGSFREPAVGVFELGEVQRAFMYAGRIEVVASKPLEGTLFRVVPPPTCSLETDGLDVPARVNLDSPKRVSTRTALQLKNQLEQEGLDCLQPFQLCGHRGVWSIYLTDTHVSFKMTDPAWNDLLKNYSNLKVKVTPKNPE